MWWHIICFQSFDCVDTLSVFSYLNVLTHYLFSVIWMCWHIICFQLSECVDTLSFSAIWMCWHIICFQLFECVYTLSVFSYLNVLTHYLLSVIWMCWHIICFQLSEWLPGTIRKECQSRKKDRIDRVINVMWQTAYNVLNSSMVDNCLPVSFQERIIPLSSIGFRRRHLTIAICGWVHLAPTCGCPFLVFQTSI